MCNYDIGNKIRVSVEFTNLLNNDAAIDPTSVYCIVLNPAGRKTEYQYGVDSEIINSDTGDYYIDLSLTLDGYWYVRWWGLDAAGKSIVAEEVPIKCIPHQAD